MGPVLAGAPLPVRCRSRAGGRPRSHARLPARDLPAGAPGGRGPRAVLGWCRPPSARARVRVVVRPPLLPLGAARPAQPPPRRSAARRAGRAPARPLTPGRPVMDPMIAIDGRDAVAPQLRGWGRYARCLIDALRAGDSDGLSIEVISEGGPGPEVVFEQ